MGSIYRKTVTRPLPNGAELITKAGEQFARWKPKTGRARTAKVVTGSDGLLRIRTEAVTFIAKYRDGSGIVREVATGCRDEDAARSILRDLERRAELVKSGVMSADEDAIADQPAVHPHPRVTRTADLFPQRVVLLLPLALQRGHDIRLQLLARIEKP